MWNWDNSTSNTSLDKVVTRVLQKDRCHSALVEAMKIGATMRSVDKGQAVVLHKLAGCQGKMTVCWVLENIRLTYGGKYSSGKEAVGNQLSASCPESVRCLTYSAELRVYITDRRESDCKVRAFSFSPGTLEHIIGREMGVLWSDGSIHRTGGKSAGIAFAYETSGGAFESMTIGVKSGVMVKGASIGRAALIVMSVMDWILWKLHWEKDTPTSSELSQFVATLVQPLR
jgi:hypothetical protein